MQLNCFSRVTCALCIEWRAASMQCVRIDFPVKLITLSIERNRKKRGENRVGMHKVNRSCIRLQIFRNF